jgi:hypothetical protein
MLDTKLEMLWPRLQDNTQIMVSWISAALENSGDKALTVLAGQTWPELLGALFQASQSADAGQREGAFRIFATTPGIIETQHEAAVQEVFAKGFKDEDVNVRAFQNRLLTPTNELCIGQTSRRGSFLFIFQIH